MKNLILGHLIFVFGVCSVPTNSSAQFGFSIDTVYTTPENANSNDQIKVVFNITTFSNKDYVGSTFGINGTEITVTSCFGLGAGGSVESIIDTLTFGQLAAGNYNLHFTAKGSYAGQPYCTTASDSGTVDVNFPVGTLNIQEQFSKMKVYPNISTGKFILEAELTENISLQIFNTAGKLLSEISVTDNKTVVDLTGSNNGVYIMRVTSNEGAKSFKIIKN